MESYADLLLKYLYNNSKKKYFEEQESLFKEKIFEMMKRENKESVIIKHPETELNYICEYNQRETKSIDYDLLLELIDNKDFNKVVTKKKSKYSIIKKKKYSKIQNETVEKKQNVKPAPPTGNIYATFARS